MAMKKRPTARTDRTQASQASSSRSSAGATRAPAAKPSAGSSKPSAGPNKPSTGHHKPSAGPNKPSAGPSKPSAAARPGRAVSARAPRDARPAPREATAPAAPHATSPAGPAPSPLSGRTRPSARAGTVDAERTAAPWRDGALGSREPQAREPALIPLSSAVEVVPGDPDAPQSPEPPSPALAESAEPPWQLDPAPPSPALDGAGDEGVELHGVDLLGREDDAASEGYGAAGLIDFGARDEDERDEDDEDVPIELAASPPTPTARDADDDVGLPEARIDRLLEQATRAADDPAARARMAEAFSEIARELSGQGSVPEAEDPGLLATAKELLSPEYYVRQWGRVAMRNRSEEVDDFGLDRSYEQRARPALEALYRRWFRVQAHGLSNVPSAGRALLVGNHAGALPWDGLMLQTAIRLEHPAHREVRWLAEDFVAHSPFLGAITNRLGAVRACPENAERLLAEEKLVAVFPEGEKGLGKPWANRYEIQRFGRGGFVKLALRTRTPIIPVAIVGSEETHPTLLRTDRLARLLGVPFLPITPTFPFLGPLGLVPLPSRWVLRFGKPIELGEEPERTQHDPVRVQHLTEEIRSAVQALVKRALEDRPSTF